nr:MAG TPA: hypothetical protein [Caudoviricetes sp.]
MPYLQLNNLLWVGLFFILQMTEKYAIICLHKDERRKNGPIICGNHL